jgi:hypothetical protein
MMFGRNISPPAVLKSKPGKKPAEAGRKLNGLSVFSYLAF